MEPNVYIPIITAVLTPLVIWTLNWVGTGGKIRKLNLHKSNLEVLSKLLEMEKEYGPAGIQVDRKLVETEISKILNDFKEEEKEQEKEGERCDYEKLNFFRKAFLLFKPIGIGGWILHLYFYQAIVLGVYGLLELFVSPVFQELPTVFIGRQVLSFVIFAFALRFWAVHLYIKRSGQKSKIPSPATTPSK